MEFKEKYPHLYVLFGTCFFVGTEEQLDDKSVLEEYVKYYSNAKVIMAKIEMADLINNPLYWKDAAYQAWRYFYDDMTLSIWIHSINNFFDKLDIHSQ